jgi:hypothetical protein
MQWTGEPREFLIDLRGIAARDQFHGELARHFNIPADHRELWGALINAIAYQTGPYRLRLRLLGWAEFEERMPRYARRLRRLIEGYQAVHGEERLAADYA